MIRVDISKFVPATALQYLAGLVPGSFFGVLVSVGNPELVIGLVSRPRSALGLGYYSSAAMALLAVFVIGNAFLVWAGLIRLLLGPIYRLRQVAWKWLVKQSILPAVTRLMREPRRKGRRWLNRLHRYCTTRVLFSTELMEVDRCWRVAQTALLQSRYGIEPSRTRDTDPGVWYSVLALPGPKDFSVNMMVAALEAAGWSGLAAFHFAPHLISRYFVTLLLLLIFGGLLHDWGLAKWRYNPVLWRIVKLRVALGQLRHTSGIPSEEEKSGGFSVEQSDE